MWVLGRSQTVVVSAYRSDDRPRRMTAVVGLRVIVYCVIRGAEERLSEKEKGSGSFGGLGFERDLMTMMLRIREIINTTMMARAHPISIVSLYFQPTSRSRRSPTGLEDTHNPSTVPPRR